MMAKLLKVLEQTTGWLAGALSATMPNRAEALPVLEAANPFRELREALLGRNRRQIAGALGAPTTASLGFNMVLAQVEPPTFWDASTWYYLFDQRDRKAIAIRFVNDRANEVEFIGAP